MNERREKPEDTDLYTLIQRSQLGERDRQIALNAVRNAEWIVDACVWIAKGVRALAAKILAKPAGLKPSH